MPLTYLSFSNISPARKGNAACFSRSSEIRVSEVSLRGLAISCLSNRRMLRARSSQPHPARRLSEPLFGRCLHSRRPDARTLPAGPAARFQHARVADRPGRSGSPVAVPGWHGQVLRRARQSCWSCCCAWRMCRSTSGITRSLNPPSARFWRRARPGCRNGDLCRKPRHQRNSKPRCRKSLAWATHPATSPTSAGKPVLLSIGLGAILVLLGGIVWWTVHSMGRQAERAPEVAETAAGRARRLAALVALHDLGPVTAATVDELAKPWSAKEFTFVDPVTHGSDPRDGRSPARRRRQLQRVLLGVLPRSSLRNVSPRIRRRPARLGCPLRLSTPLIPWWRRPAMAPFTIRCRWARLPRAPGSAAKLCRAREFARPRHRNQSRGK